MCPYCVYVFDNQLTIRVKFKQLLFSATYS
jgi:hypothetical protein